MKWNEIISNLPKEPNKHGIWTDGDEILCKSEQQAERIADFLESLEFDCVITGYYDEEEVVDKYTGYYYVNVD